MENKKFIEICQTAVSMAEAARIIGIGFNSFKKKALILNCYKTNQNWRKGKTVLNDDRIESKHTLFCENSSARREYIKGLIIKHNLIEYKCFDCGLKNEWNGKILNLQLDHINGVKNDNRLENLRFMCPNCHSQTETWCKSKGNSINNLDIEILINTINESFSMTKLIDKLGIYDTQNNRKKIKKIMIENNLSFEFDKQEKNKINSCKCGKSIKKSSKMCSKGLQIEQRKINRPTYEQLKKEVEEIGYSATGRKYNVSDNCIRKWLKAYVPQLAEGHR